MPMMIHWTEEATQLARNHNVTREARSGTRNEGRTYAALYYNRPMTALAASEGGMIIGFDGLKELGFNVLAEMLRGGKAQIVQALQARITPVGGDAEKLRACELLGQVIDGINDRVDFTDLAGRLVLDGAIFGEGYGLSEMDPIKKDIEDFRLDPMETFFNFDHTEVKTLRAFSRRKAAAYWPKKADIIKSTATPSYRPEHMVEVDLIGEMEDEDIVGVYCGWTTTVGSDKGKFVYQLYGTETILDQGEWDGPLPVFAFQWDHGHRDNTSKPAARSIAPMHYWINQITRKTYDALEGNVPVVIGDADPKWSDVPYQFIQKGDGASVVMPNLSGLQHNNDTVRDLREQSAREIGMSEEAVHADAPPQFKSGIALSNWREIINKGISQQHRGYARVHTDAARIKLYLMQKHYDKNRQAQLKAIGTEVIEQIDWSKVSMPEDSYQMSFDVVSALPKSIPQKLELLAYLEEKGQIDADEVLLHINIPDFKAVAKRRAGPRALMELQISRALSEGELIPPTEVQDSAKLAELAGQAYQAATAQKVPPARKNLQALLHLYLMAKAGAPQPAAPAPAAATPPAPGLTPEPTGAVGGGEIADVPSPSIPAPSMPNEPLPVS